MQDIFLYFEKENRIKTIWYGLFKSKWWCKKFIDIYQSQVFILMTKQNEITNTIKTNTMHSSDFLFGNWFKLSQPSLCFTL